MCYTMFVRLRKTLKKESEEIKMKYYSREVTRREKTNSFGRLGYVLYVEFFKTNNEKTVEKFNKGKKIRFSETEDRNIVKILRSGEKDTIYEERKL